MINKCIVYLCLCMFVLNSDIIFFFTSFVFQVLSYLEARSALLDWFQETTAWENEVNRIFSNT